MATLKSLVDETTNIKNELVECYGNLKNNLIEKGVECSEDDKMSSLINKVGNIYSPKVVAGNTTEVWSYAQISSVLAGDYNKKVTSFKGFLVKGSYRIKFSLNTFVTGNRGVCTVKHIRNSSVINEKTVYASYKNNNQYTSFTIDFEDINVNDAIEFYHGLENNSSGQSNLMSLGIYCNLI